MNKIPRADYTPEEYREIIHRKKEERLIKLEQCIKEHVQRFDSRIRDLKAEYEELQKLNERTFLKRKAKRRMDRIELAVMRVSQKRNEFCYIFELAGLEDALL